VSLNDLYTDENGKMYDELDFPEGYPQRIRLYMRPRQTIDGVEYKEYTSSEQLCDQYVVYFFYLYPEPVSVPPADFGFVSATTDKPSYDVGETVWIAFVAGNVGGGSGVFTVEFYDDDTGVLLASFEGPLFVPPGGESDPFAVNVGAMPAKDWNIRCEITP